MSVVCEYFCNKCMFDQALQIDAMRNAPKKKGLANRMENKPCN